MSDALLSLIRDDYNIENPFLTRGDHEAALAAVVKALLMRWPQIARAMEPGMVVVPRKATEEMEAAGWIDKEDVSPSEIFAAMIAAAQEPKL